MCLDCQPVPDADLTAVPVARPTVPVAGPIHDVVDAVDAGSAPALAEAELVGDLDALAGPAGAPSPIPPVLSCGLDLRDGCWTLSVNLGGTHLVGTLRVDRGTGHLIISGDLYRDPKPVIV